MLIQVRGSCTVHEEEREKILVLFFRSDSQIKRMCPISLSQIRKLGISVNEQDYRENYGIKYNVFRNFVNRPIIVNVKNRISNMCVKYFFFFFLHIQNTNGGRPNPPSQEY
jgi:hypothetical protein